IHICDGQRSVVSSQMRGRSYTPSPPRGYSRRGRSPSPRGRYGGRGRDLPTSLLVRNLRHDCRHSTFVGLALVFQSLHDVLYFSYLLESISNVFGKLHALVKLTVFPVPEDLRRPFGEFGPLKDVYLPRDYYTGEPRGFGFVQYVDPADAAEAKYQMDGQIFHGRELTVVFAEENRKKPAEMRQRERSSYFHLTILNASVAGVVVDMIAGGLLLAILVLHLLVMQDHDLAVVIIHPPLKGGIILVALFHLKTGGTVGRGHTHALLHHIMAHEAAAKVRGKSRVGAQAGAEVEAPSLKNTQGNQVKIRLPDDCGTPSVCDFFGRLHFIESWIL
ncbi:RNA recognition motif domain, partial [Dillenia turbinata]